MRIKRYCADDMRGALRQVREEQGENAVILSSRRTDAGVEVVAATDHDEALIAQFLRGTPRAAATTAAKPAARSATPPMPVTPAGGSAARPATNPAVPAKPIPAKPAPAAAVKPPAARANISAGASPPRSEHLRSVPESRSEPDIASVRRELTAMRALIENQMTRFAEERLRGVPVRAMALDELLACGCDREMARSIVTRIPASSDRKRARGLMLGLLAKAIPVPGREPLEAGGVIALVGASGVGKTTTTAKLAARFAATHGTRDVALVTTDTQRAGGREQLVEFGRRLGMPVFDAKDGGELVRLLARLADYPLVLVDTAGTGARDRAIAAQFNWVASPRKVRSFLVLPANAQADDLDAAVRRFRPAAPEGIVLSMVDETVRLGSSLSVLAHHRLPLAWFTDGRNVPGDIHRGEAHRLVLRMSEIRRQSLEPASMEVSHAIA